MLAMIAVFPASAWARSLAALGYAGVVALAVWAVDGRSDDVPVAEAFRAPAGACAVRAEATFPVGHWSVLVDGVEVAGSVDAHAWSGTVSGREVLVQAERTDAADQTPGALRLVVGQRTTVAWGEGTVSASLATTREDAVRH